MKPTEFRGKQAASKFHAEKGQKTAGWREGKQAQDKGLESVAGNHRESPVMTCSTFYLTLFSSVKYHLFFFYSVA